MNRPDLYEPSLGVSPRPRLFFGACACTLLTVGACGVDERSPTLTSAGAAPEFESGLGQGGSGSPAAPSGNEAASNAGAGGDMQGSATEGAPEVEGINPDEGTSDEASAGGAPIEGMPMTGPDPAAPADIEPAPIVRPEGPCDIYAAANLPCVGAYSMVRALSSGYTGALYQVRRGAANPSQNTGAGGETQDIGVLANGFADAAAQQTFCGNQPCTVSILYDQSGQGNHLTAAPAGCFTGSASQAAFESSAMDAVLTVGGNTLYGLYMRPQEGYRNNVAVNTPEGEEEAGIYMLAAGSASRPDTAPGCCWDFGISSRDNCLGPVGATNALFLGTGFWGRGAGAGPWFLGDFEAGLWAGGVNGNIAVAGSFDVNPNNPSMTMEYAFGILKTRPNNYALRMGDAIQGNLTTAYDGPTPMPRWQMAGGIILGIAGDNTNQGEGTFFEGAVTAGRPSDALDEAILQNVRAAGYGR